MTYQQSMTIAKVLFIFSMSITYVCKWFVIVVKAEKFRYTVFQCKLMW